MISHLSLISDCNTDSSVVDSTGMSLYSIALWWSSKLSQDLSWSKIYALNYIDWVNQQFTHLVIVLIKPLWEEWVIF